jgi:hypothetical protein
MFLSRQEDCEFKASLDYIVRPYPKKTNKIHASMSKHQSK